MILKRVLIIFMAACCLALFAAPVFAQSGDGGNAPEQPDQPDSPEMASTNYRLEWYVLGSGSFIGTSTNYRINGTIGQPVVGDEKSANYGLCNGFWCLLRTWRIRLPLIFNGIW